jgi:NAD(P)-dependent dehydrogenase (short-subunit alcohol dehydrogenase family)
MNKVVLVTGASSGLGKAIAEELVRKGRRVYGTSRNPGTATENGVLMVPLDVTDDSSVAKCVREVAAAEGRIDVLVNVAGYGLSGSVEDTTIEEARQQLETNFFGVARMTREVLPVMRTQEQGRIITISSMAGFIGLPYQPYYSASKFAVEGLNEALRLELTGSGIDTCTIDPGDFKTGFTAARVHAKGAQSPLHSERMAGVVGTYERDETNGADPQLVADLVTKLVDRRRLRVRYVVAKPAQQAAALLKSTLPATTFEWVMTKMYPLR